jgi:hypothetical protein
MTICDKTFHKDDKRDHFVFFEFVDFVSQPGFLG